MIHNCFFQRRLGEEVAQRAERGKSVADHHLPRFPARCHASHIPSFCGECSGVGESSFRHSPIWVLYVKVDGEGSLSQSANSTGSDIRTWAFFSTSWHKETQSLLAGPDFSPRRQPTISLGMRDIKLNFTTQRRATLLTYGFWLTPFADRMKIPPTSSTASTQIPLAPVSLPPNRIRPTRGFLE